MKNDGIIAINNKDKAIPKVVYQYRDYSKSYYRDILRNGEIYMTSPLKFSDNEDCNILEYMPQCYQDFYLYYVNHQKIFHNRKADWKLSNDAKKYAEGMYLEYLLDKKGFGERWKQIEVKKRITGIGISCFTDTYLSEKAWKDYAKECSGICIGFYTELLHECVKGSMHWVNYYEQLPICDPRIDDFETMYLKKYYSKIADKYSWENEFRFFKTFSPKSENVEKDRHIKIPSDTVAAIIVGRCASKETKDDICSISHLFYPNAELIIL